MACSQCSTAAGLRGRVLWEDGLWLVVHKRPPCGVVGHLLLLSKRHFQGPAHFTDEEASTVGLTLRRCERVLQEVTRCERVYTAALGSSAAPHFHAHMMPVYHPGEGIGVPAEVISGTPFDVFLQEKLAKEGKLEANPSLCDQVSESFALAMNSTDGTTELTRRSQ
ncbi:hypothetical protein AB1Y20_011476 [Prymnesium parvum]|uniref:HIT domain-containing protein n=1 Tax=Prymnesium parvum TaxID=97485 RepID=A0AB34II77_PRYPA